MAIKTKLEDQELEAVKVDIPLFATAEDAVKDIQVDEQTVIKIHVEEKHD